MRSAISLASGESNLSYNSTSGELSLKQLTEAHSNGR